MDAEPRQPATLPLDLLLEIVARSDDVTTVVRCAVGCKALLAAMLDPGFHRRRAEANGGFDPGLLMAVSYRPTAGHIDSDEGTVTGTDSVIVHPPGRLRHFDTDLLAGSSGPLSSRDGLLVVHHRHGILLVCNTITGHVTPLPSMGQGGTSTAAMYKPALLSVHGAGRSFELLVMYHNHKHYPWRSSAGWSLRTQIFSSREGEWGAARDIHICNMDQCLYEASSTAPAVVVGRSVHWLCYTKASHYSFDAPELIILALHAESAQATVIKLPQELLTRMGSHGSGSNPNPAERFILATTAATAQGERRLSLVVAEALVISMWTPGPQVDEGSGISWSRQVVLRRREIGGPLACVLDAYQPILFSRFGERSGTVLFWVQRTGLVQLNLGTKKALVLYKDSVPRRSEDKSQALLHEINLISVLRCMKSF